MQKVKKLVGSYCSYAGGEGIQVFLLSGDVDIEYENQSESPVYEDGNVYIVGERGETATVEFIGSELYRTYSGKVQITL